MLQTGARMARQVLEVDVWVGRAVAELRQQQGLSQSALAAALGISFQQVQKYEAGTNRLSAGRLYHLAQILGCPVAAFFPASVSEDNERPDVSTPEARRMMVSYSRIEDRAVRRSVGRIVEALALRE